MAKELSFEEFVNLLSSLSGLTDEELSKELGVSRQTLSKMRHNEISRLKSTTLYNINEALKRNKWGLSFGKIRGNKIEVENISVKENSTNMIAGRDINQNTLNYLLERIITLEKEKEQLLGKLNQKTRKLRQ